MVQTGEALSSLLSFKEIEYGIEGNTSECGFRILVYSDQIIRVNISHQRKFDNHSYASVAYPKTDPEFQIRNSSESIHIKTTSLVLKISKNPVRFSFYNQHGNEISCEDAGMGTLINNQQTASYRKLQEGERFIGLGEKAGNLDRRGTGLINWNTDHFGYGSETDPLYSSIPFYIGIHHGLVYGIFLDNSSKSHFNFGASNNRFSSFAVEQGNLDYYFIYGGSVAEIIQNYTHITGRMEMPPIWSLGYQQCRYSYFPEKEVLTLANNFRDKNIPCDAIVLDIHYMDKFKIFSWDLERFPDPGSMIGYLKQLGFQVVVICDPGIKIEEGYEPYDDGLKENVFVKYPDGSNYEAEVWPGMCCFPDFTNPATRKWWGKHLKTYTELGIEGFWNDMNEIASWGNFMPNAMSFHYEGNQVSTLMARNIYGLEMARSSYEGAKDLLNGKRPFNLTRAAFAGVQRYSAKWTGDNSASDEHMILGIKLQNSLGLSGVSFTGNDIGGFHKDSTPELYARWIALGAFSPYFRGHSMVNTRDSEPWTYGETIEEISRNYINLRYQLLPYLYSLFYESVLNGLPVVRSLAIEHTFLDIVYEKEYQAQYYFGPFILVAPIRSNQTIAKVFLPGGTWYDMLTGSRFQGNSEVYIDTPIYKIPLFVKGGSLIPSQPVIQSTQNDPGEEMTLHIYFGSGKSTFHYFEDDGSTYAYKTGEYYSRIMTYDGAIQKIILDKPEGFKDSKFKKVKAVLHGFEDNNEFTLNGQKIEKHLSAWKFVEPLQNYDPQSSVRNDHPEKIFLCYFDLQNEHQEISWT